MSYGRFRPQERVLIRRQDKWHPAQVLYVWFNCYIVSPAPGVAVCVLHDPNWIRPDGSPKVTLN